MQCSWAQSGQTRGPPRPLEKPVHEAFSAWTAEASAGEDAPSELLRRRWRVLPVVRGGGALAVADADPPAGVPAGPETDPLTESDAKVAEPEARAAEPGGFAALAV